tara:strand:+ start:182 stop:604 length:423 start_codon:yes stop_codon:yes gene_type:complete
MNFKKISILLFLCTCIDCLKLDYYVKTKLTNDQIFNSKNINMIIGSKDNIIFNNNTSFDYNTYVKGIKIRSKMTLLKNDDIFKIYLDNYYMNNIITFKKNTYNILHINLISSSKIGIPNYIQKKILDKKINNIINIIHEL